MGGRLSPVWFPVGASLSNPSILCEPHNTNVLITWLRWLEGWLEGLCMIGRLWPSCSRLYVCAFGGFAHQCVVCGFFALFQGCDIQGWYIAAFRSTDSNAPGVAVDLWGVKLRPSCVWVSYMPSYGAFLCRAIQWLCEEALYATHSFRCGNGSYMYPSEAWVQLFHIDFRKKPKESLLLKPGLKTL